MSMLEKAENDKNIDQIKSLFAQDVILYTPDLPPINGINGVVSIYEYVFANSTTEFVKYVTDSSYSEQNYTIELGKNINKRIGMPADTNDFKALFIQQGDYYKISEISFGKEESLKRKIPDLIKPTGKYRIGQSTHFYKKEASGNNRMLSFQIWYPAKDGKGSKTVYKSKEVVKASADFLGFPLFMVSYFSSIESNSFLNVPACQNQKFPVLLYNHGYGGFTSVYQTVFEELASHGYIVVSIGHENESALLLKEDGSVITNDPENVFYTNRAAELSGSEIGELQNIILFSDDLNENQEAYPKLIELSPLHNESTRLWQSDTKAVYTKLEKLDRDDVNLKGAFDLESVGVFGHSVGGATAGQLGMEDGLVKAGINLDGFQFGDLVNNKLKVPFMFISSNEEGDRYLRASTFIDKAETNCYQVTIRGFSHASFTDLEYFLSGNERMIELQREVIRGFFDKYLKNENIDLKKMETKYENLSVN